MALSRSEFVLHIEGHDAPVAVTADQRDYAAAEAHFGAGLSQNNAVNFTRYIAWSAAKRRGVVAHAFNKFNAELLIEVEDVTASESDEDGNTDNP